LRALAERVRLGPGCRPRDDRGATVLEFAGFLPILIVVGMAAVQLGLIGYGITQAGTAARAAARAASLEGTAAGEAAGALAASGWLSPAAKVGGPGSGTVTATVIVTVPSVIPLFDPVRVERSVTMPADTVPG
jgi:Flp pilus assembly protein TadG